MAPLGAFSSMPCHQVASKSLPAVAVFSLLCTGAASVAGIEDVLEADCPSQQAATVFMMQSKFRLTVDEAFSWQSPSRVVAHTESHPFNQSRNKDWLTRPLEHDLSGVGHMPDEIEFHVGAQAGAVPAKGKWVLAALEVLALGFFGVDRCYMGQVCAGIVKGFTLGGLGVWFLLDYLVIMITCLSHSPFINALGYRAEFVDGTAGINASFLMAALSVCIFPIIFTVAAVTALHAKAAKPLPAAELDEQKLVAEPTDPDSSAAPENCAKSPGIATTEGELRVVVETEEEKEQRKKELTEARLVEFGEAVPLSKLLSLASNFELFLFGLGMTGGVLQGCAQPVQFIFMGRLLDAIAAEIDENFLHRVHAAAVGMILAGCAAVVLGFAQSYGLNYFTELQVAKMRPMYFRALLYRDIGWFDTHDAESLPTDLDEDMQSYRVGMGLRLGTSVSATAQVIASLVVSFFCCWQIALVMIAALPLNFVAGACFAAGATHQADRQAVYSRAAKLADEVLFAIRTVVSFGAEFKELDRYKKAVDEAKRGGINVRVKFGLGYGWVAALFIVSIGAAFYVGMLLIVSGHDLSVGRISAAVYAAIGSASMVGSIMPGFLDFNHARRRMARFFHVLETQGEIQKHVNDERTKCPPIQTLELVNVHFVYPARPDIQVLKDVALKIEKGQRVAVVGESGSGKSTIMALLERFYDPMYGVVLVNGLNLRQFDVKSYRAQIGYVGQEPVLFAASVKSNILQGCKHASMKDVQQVAKYANLDFVDALPEKFETFVGSGGSQFSGGQKQRIAIARALIKGPSFLFFDEATSALDNTSEKVIQKAIDNIATSSELGVTTVTIAHRLSTVKNSDIIYVMRHGELVEQGTHSRLTSQPEGVYRSLAAAQGLDLDENAEVDKEETADLPSKQVNVMVDQSKIDVEGDEVEKLRQAEIAKSYSVPMARLMEFCRPEWWAFLPAMLGAAISGISLPICGGFLVMHAVVAFVEYAEPYEMGKLRNSQNHCLMLFLLLGLTQFLGTWAQTAFFGVLGESLIGRCRAVLFKSMLCQDIGFFDNPANTPARLVKALQVYAYRINELCTNIGENANAVSAVIAGVVISFTSQWQIALLMVTLLPAIAIANYIDMRISWQIAVDEDQGLKEASHIVADSLSAQGARAVHASSAEEVSVELYSKIVRSRMQLGRAFAGRAAAFAISKGMLFFVLALAYWYMGFLIVRGQAILSESLRAFMGVLYAGLGAAVTMAGVSDMTKAKVAAHDLFEILDQNSLIDGMEASGMTLVEEGSCVGRIEFVHVNFLYPWRPDVSVLRDMSFTIEAGQSVGVCGPSGGGKSTLFSLLQRFYDPTGGRVLVGAARTPLNQLSVRWWRRQVGFVGQEPLLFEASILDNIMYGVQEDDDLSKDRLLEVYRMAHLGFVDSQPDGWDTQVGPRGSRLSGGQKQRVAIARALMRNPPILLFDEATSALDSKSEKVVSQALEEARQGRTSLTIAHRLSTIQNCDLLMVIADGTVVESGTHTQLLMQNGVYSKLQAVECRSTISCSSVSTFSYSANGTVSTRTS